MRVDLLPELARRRTPFLTEGRLLDAEPPCSILLRQHPLFAVVGDFALLLGGAGRCPSLPSLPNSEEVRTRVLFTLLSCL